MAQYVMIQQFGARQDAAATRRSFQETLDYFVRWQAPDGVAMVHLWVALDFSRAVTVWEADDPITFATTVAGFVPFAPLEVIPVGDGDPMIGAMAGGGLVRMPGAA